MPSTYIPIAIFVAVATGFALFTLVVSGLFATEDRAIGMTAFVDKAKPTFLGR